MLPQQWRRIMSHSWRPGQVDGSGDIFVCANHRVLKFGEEIHFIEMWVGGEVTRIAGHADGAAKRLPLMKEFSLRLLHVPRDEARLKFVGTGAAFKLVLQHRVICKLSISSQQRGGSCLFVLGAAHANIAIITGEDGAGPGGAVTTARAFTHHASVGILLD